MKAIAHILFALLLLAALAGGCRRAPSEGERALIALDSLIATNPDSALAQLLAVDTAALDEPCRAYRALLAAQARYKAYVRATDSTDITRAWRYYRHSGPYDRRIRAMLYRGTVAEELEHHVQAILHYQVTVQNAHSDDHYHRGYALMAMAHLYETVIYDSQTAVRFYREALRHLRIGGYNKEANYCQTEIARVYQNINLDSAETLITEAIRTVQTYGDSLPLFENYVNLTNCYFMKKDYEKAIQLGQKLLHSGKLARYQMLQCAYALCHSYTDLGQLDSAERTYALMPPPIDLADTIRHLRSLAEMARVRHDMDAYLRYNTASINKTESVLMVSSKSSIKNAEFEFKINVLEDELDWSHEVGKWLLWVVVALLVWAVCIKVRNHLKITNLRKEITQIQNRITSEQQKSASVEDQSRSRQNAYSAQLECIREFFELILHAAPRRSSSLKPDLKQVEILEEQWQTLQQSLDVMLDGFVSELTNVYGCADSFVKVFCLCYCGASNNMVALCLPLKMQTIANIKQKLAHRVLGEEMTWTNLLEYLKNRVQGIE